MPIRVMPSLLELQSQLSKAMIGDDVAIGPILSKALLPARRLAIHRRHYRTSLVNALVQKFPGTAWLLGEPLFAETAARFVTAHPPTAPCIAEYGEAFPRFLATIRVFPELPYLAQFGQMEWHLGKVAISIDAPALGLQRLTSLQTSELPDLTFRLQPGVRHFNADWPIDEPMQRFLSACAPEPLALGRQDTWLELRGSRGSIGLTRLTPDDYSFRSLLAHGVTIELAARTALQINPVFDLTAAFSKLFADGLVVGISPTGSDRHGDD